MLEIGREHGRKAYKFWADKVHPKDGAKLLNYQCIVGAEYTISPPMTV